METLVTGALNRFRSGRVIDANTVAGNQHKGYQIVPSLGAGCRIGMLNDLWILVPSLTASLIYSHEDGYTETGGGSNNQRINGRCSSQLRTEGGFSISRHKNYKNVQALYTVGLKAILQEPLKREISMDLLAVIALGLATMIKERFMEESIFLPNSS